MQSWIRHWALEGVDGGIKFGGVKVKNLRYADDTTLLCSSRQDLMNLLFQVKSASEEKGLLLFNTKNATIMVLDKNDSGVDFLLDRQKIAVVKQFEYQESLINNKCDSTTEIKRRSAIARKTSQSMENIWKSKGITMNLKLRFLRPCVFSIATYGSESWAMTHNNRKRVDAFEMWCYRRLLRVSWKDIRTSDWVLSMVRYELMLRKTIDSRKLRYLGHISRKDDSIEKFIMQGTVEGSRGRGRPSTSWTDDIKRYSGLSLTAATRLAVNRTGWRPLVRATAAPVGAT